MRTRTVVAVSLFLSLCAIALSAQQQHSVETLPDGTRITRSVQEIAAAKPGIVVTDINFGYRPVGLPALISNPFHITNRGNAKLTITKNSGVVPSSMAAVFDISEVKAQTFPLVLGDVNSGDNEKTFRIKFTPNKTGVFDATLTFSSNGQGIDSVCRLHGVGIEPGIAVNGCEFGRRRVGASYDSDVEGGPAQLTVINSLGGKTSTVNSYTISGNVSEFELDDLSDLKGMAMNPAQEIIRAVKFKPTKPGYDTLRITFTVSTGSPITFIATGVGVTPHLQFSETNVGTANLADTAKASIIKTFNITNLDVTTTPKWEFFDDVLIDDVGSANGGTEIGTAGKAAPGTEGFSILKTQFDLPLFIGAGLTTADFTIWYQPAKVGKNSAVFAMHDIDYDTSYVVTFSGEAIQDASGIEDDASYCSLAPNPVQSSVVLGFRSVAARRLLLRDAMGRELRQAELIESDRVRLNTADLNAGVYVVEIHDAEGIHMRRFVKD